MKDLALIKETMSSVEIAELTGKQHYHVKLLETWNLLGKRSTNQNFDWLNIKMRKVKCALCTS